MSDNNSFEGTLPTREPQAPRSISVESVDKGSRVPDLNPGGESHGGECSQAGEPSRD